MSSNFKLNVEIPSYSFEPSSHLTIQSLSKRGSEKSTGFATGSADSTLRVAAAEISSHKAPSEYVIALYCQPSIESSTVRITRVASIVRGVVLGSSRRSSHPFPACLFTCH